MTESNAGISTEAVIAALRNVQDPELGKDLVSLGMIKDVETQGSRVTFSIELTTPACPMRSEIARQAREAVQAIPGVSQVDVRLESKVPRDSRTSARFGGRIRNAIAVASGKGGVGKTTVAVNVAAALAQAGACVGLLDADVYGPNVPTMLGLEHLPPSRGGRIVPAEANGVRVMSLAFFIPPGQAVIWRGPLLHSTIQQFVSEVEWGDLDYMVVDLPPGTGDAPLSLLQTVPLSGVVIVTMPQKVSLEDARRSLEMFRMMKVPILGVVENMSYLELPGGERMDIFGQGGGEALARDTGVPFIQSVPLDPRVRQSGDSGVPVVIAEPESPAAYALNHVAQHVAAQISVLSMGGTKGDDSRRSARIPPGEATE